MASVDAAGDPLSAAASATSLLLWTLGPAAAAASPSRACGALLGGPLKRSKELMEQARLVLKERGDIQKLYQEDGMNVAAAVNDKNNQQGRRPGLDRKRARFSLKPPQSNPAQDVDFSQLQSIEDPDEYFSTLDQLEEADKEIKKLRGEVPTKTTDHHRPVEPPKRRPGMSRRKSVYSYNFRAGVDTTDVTEAPVSQIETITESQSIQDDMAPSAPEGTKLPVPSSSSQFDIPDVSTREDSFAEKGKGALDELLSAFKNLDEAEEENLIREKLQIKEISIGKVCLPDLFNSPNDRPVSSTTKRKHLTNGHTPERSVSGIHHARISKWEKQILDKDILNDKADLSEDDESDNSPGIVTGQQSTGHGHNSVVSTGGEASTGRETPTSSTKSPDHVLETVPNVPNGVSTDESEPRSSSFGVCIDSEVATEKDTSSRHNVSLEEDDVPMDQPVIERPHYEQTISSPHHLEGDTTEVPGSVPGRNASTLHDEDDNIEHQGGVGGDGLVQGEPVHLTEIPPDAHNQSHIQDGTMEERAVDISCELSLSKDGKQKAVQKRKNKKQSANRGKRIPGEPIHTPEIPSEDIDPQNQSHINEGNFEKPAVRISSQLSPAKDSKQKQVEDGKRKQPLRSGKRGAGEPIHTPEIPSEDIDPQNQSHINEGNFEKPAVRTSSQLSPGKDSKQKQVEDGKRKQPLRSGKRGAEEASDPLAMPPENCDTETQPHMHDANIEQHIVGTRALRSPNDGKGQKETQRRKKRQELHGRKSLAAFGFSWQSGVRRSTRIRSRPLQEWRGERFLYGRIHKTMSTVIGIKSYSPSQDGKVALRVKSFVPEQYSDILAHAAKY